ncbi:MULTISPECIES: DUF4199 domain-containing protein [Pontibacter]|uniref:DUF4199 domain-containing protein n=1 Tax=Pontibacter lucknowensis TaxID=1077936 RepID=A0A1N6Z0H4_9BACT|nr:MULTISPECIES: DUF4199 domain-containing protein [Pontibacter]EJF11439.1 hypothetical protein O71_02942 [Pontibacter sp. BAB1700]SIR20358.1 Protein of unknown function [Pontibacter lucknowensis]
MTETQPSVSSVALKYGFIGALVSVVFTAVLLITGVNVSGWVGSLGYLILIAFMVIAMKEYKKQNYGYMSYGQGLGIGTLVSLAFGVLGGVFMFIYTSFVDTEYTSNMMDKQRIELEERGMSDEQIEQAISMGESFSSPMMMIVWSIVGYLFIGFLISLIVAAVMKNKRPEFE